MLDLPKIKKRFQQYFNINYLIKNPSMYICNSLLKFGYSNFSLEILEYCPIELLLEGEKHYIDLLDPEYNICPYPAAPMLGRIHSEETRLLISKKMKDSSWLKSGENHPMYGHKHSDETLQKYQLLCKEIITPDLVNQNQ